MTFCDSFSPPQKVLALDTSTDRMAVAVGAAGQAPLAQYEGAGGAQASAHLLSVIRRLLDGRGWRVADLDAIAFGAGPGAFTGLRTACAVVQGLALAGRPGGIPVLPVHTLLAVAQDALAQWLAREGAWPGGAITVAMDARMDELYTADVEVLPPLAPGQGWRLGLVQPARLLAPAALATVGGWPAAPDRPAPVLLAGNAAGSYGHRWSLAWQALPQIEAWPRAEAVLRLGAAVWAHGQAVAAADAQPLYVRDKVAQTTEERAQARSVQALASQGRA
jgi:tRNA threonylcarbamoyladenosine biosynthesis protein TsaB